MKEEKRVLVFSDWFEPGFKAGGPIRSISNIVSNLKDSFNFLIVTSDRDLGDEKPYDEIVLNQIMEKDDLNILYLSPDNQRQSFYKKLIIEHKPDIIYLNSMFSFRFALLPLLILRFSSISAKVILAPRGMLGKGALGIKSFKKNVFFFASNVLGLFSKVTWHATSEQEKIEIQNIFGDRSKVLVAKNIPTAYKNQSRIKNAGELTLLFYSRISEKKNLLEALKIILKAKLNGKITFNIVGPVESGTYWSECQKIITDIESGGGSIVIKYHGAIEPNLTVEHFKLNHLFFLPTRHENFGHVIAEALSSSMPVLISDQTPWIKLEENQAGFDLPLNEEESFIRVLNLFLSMNQNEYDLWSKGARVYFEKQIDLESIVSSTRNVFLTS